MLSRRLLASALVAASVATACGSNGEAQESSAETGEVEISTTVSEATTTTVEALEPSLRSADPAPGAVETRDEILLLAGLPLEGGGSFDPDTVAGTDVLIWFWGPH